MINRLRRAMRAQSLPLIAGFAIDHAGHDIASAASAALFAAAWAMVALWGGSLPGGSGKRAEASRSSLKERLSDKAVLGVILDETDLYADEQLGRIAREMGFAEQLSAVIDRLGR